ncbi:winged helix-turn-helix domain-containing protein [Pseudoxanthomonas helianthi]|uniref:Winged helix-turn-helix domain-containing protein n=1 Tax=Pseudoxanthomonas helianthi TaxID=1453541 RepID=A0A941AVG4_9GAMM|nr:winged helix-turn-helix domain-containing protein [Pseudoxanthomonas helianthi]MBP3983973.1 winged helix-turn-helix domain-containing protein [Pseudoxanthomonas helianthi]
MSQPQPARLAFDDVVIDVPGQRLWRGGTEQPLEPKAFAVLALLAASPGRVFGRDEILDAVWGHRHVTPGVLNRVMTLLRHALGEDAQSPRYLHTVHGVGYRFDLPAGLQAAPVETGPPATPSTGVGPAPDSPRRRASDQPAPSRRFATPWLLPLLAVLAFAGWRLWPREAPVPAVAPSAEPRSIAVLPLANASRDADQQFFSDGLSENLIDALSKSEGLKVIGPTSSFRFRDGKDDSRTIGAKLGVAYLVGGSVQRAGDMVRINANLTRVADGSTLWAEHYDRPYQDLFALQDEIARAVANALQVKLLQPRDATRQDKRPPSGNMEAYNAFLRGMRSFYQQDWRKAVEYQSLATRLDPGYSTAWAEQSVAWALIGYAESGDEARTAFRNARVAVDKALALAPDLGIAHGALGNLLLGGEFDWRGSIAEFRRGTQLDPDNGPVHGGFSRALAASGRLQDAIGERQRFLAIDPLAPFNYTLYADLLIATGRLDEAESNLRISRDLQPGSTPRHQLMYIAILRGDAKTALDIAHRMPSPWQEMDVAVAAQIASDPKVADAALAKVLKDKAWAGTSPYVVAQAYALRGDADKTVEWLELTWSRRDTSIHHLLYDPLILRFRDDPRLVAFCSKIGLPPPSQSEALSIDQIRASLAAKR